MMSASSNSLSFESKSPVDIATLILVPLIFSNFLNSSNFSDASARNGVR